MQVNKETIHIKPVKPVLNFFSSLGQFLLEKEKEFNMLQPKIKFLIISSIVQIILILLLLLGPVAYAQVDLEINDNMLVETTGGLEIEVSGDVVENGSGYLEGIVTSGDRNGVTQFAGLTLSSSLEGKITRTTGTQYSGTGTNFTRYYEVDNQNTSSDLEADVRTATTSAEAGSLIGPFFHYTKNGSNWAGYGFGSTGISIRSSSVTFPQNSATDLVISEGVGVKAKIFLEGPYNTSSNEMNTTINDDIPITSPYSSDSRTASTKPTSAVDWVLVELRDQTTPSNVIASRSAFLDTDGNLIDDDETSGRGIGITAPPGNYFVAIRHRNHLAVMTESVLTGLTWGTASTVASYDFTTGSGQYYGGNSGAKEIDTDVWGMIAGDANSDGEVTYNGGSNDKNSILSEVGLLTPNDIISTYSNNDINMDGVVKYNGSSNDKNKILGVVGLSTPNNVIQTQVP